MKKENPQIKDISLIDRINCINEYVSYYFTRNNTGVLEYTPYYAQIGLVISIMHNFITGVTFDEEKDNIYELVQSDSDLSNLFHSVEVSYKDDLHYIQSQVDDIVKFKKQQLVHSHSSIDDKIKEILAKESKRLDAETNALASAERLSVAQAIQVENQNKVNDSFTVEEQVEITRKMAEVEFDPEKIASNLVDKLISSQAIGKLS